MMYTYVACVIVELTKQNLSVNPCQNGGYLIPPGICKCPLMTPATCAAITTVCAITLYLLLQVKQFKFQQQFY